VTARTFAAANSTTGELAMRKTSWGTEAANPPGFWRGMAEVLDAYVTTQARRAVPEVTWRRSKQEIDRYRRVLHHGVVASTRIRQALWR
jgi:hypothetical protein